MRMSDLIVKKRDGQALTTEEIRYVVDGYTRGEIPDYQMSAMLMAIYFRGMDRRETLDLTMAMVHSGETLDLSGVSGVKADKHSTGGVGDKTSLVLVPMVASLGVKMAKMSGRGLGHTGGTLDKLESIPGFNIDLPMERFLDNVDRVGMVIAGQTANLAPADKKMYALRDVTGTVNCIPLIASSIVSKKLASGAGAIVLDVKTGSGALMHTLEDSIALAKAMVDIGAQAGKPILALVTGMEQPLGTHVGNALEVKEAISVLRGADVPDLRELCLVLGTNILVRSGLAETEEEARARLEKSIESGAALDKLAAMVRAQGGDPAAVVFDAVSAAKARGIDVVICDTAGRLPTQANLMEELRRIHRSQNKALEGAPHEVLLVLDGTNGQNALAQVKAFDAAVKVTGLIITKLDGTAKGGVLAAICAMRAEAPLPIYFIGVGEQLADLQRFRAVPFANALVGLDPDYPETASSN